MFVSSRLDLSVKETLLVKKRKWLQMQSMTLRKLNGIATLEVPTAVLLLSLVF
jgi:hypothetical protein